MLSFSRPIDLGAFSTSVGIASTVNISVILSSASVKVEENMPKPVRCQISPDNYKEIKGVVTLEWVNQDGSPVPTRQNDGDFQTAFRSDFSLTKKPEAYLFVSGKGDFVIYIATCSV